MGGKSKLRSLHSFSEYFWKRIFSLGIFNFYTLKFCHGSVVYKRTQIGHHHQILGGLSRPGFLFSYSLASRS